MHPKSECQYGGQCYRKNPIHFKEFSHPQLEAIVLKGKNAKNEYDIPDDLLAPKDDTRQQLNMIERILNVAPRAAAAAVTTKPHMAAVSTPKRPDLPFNPVPASPSTSVIKDRPTALVTPNVVPGGSTPKRPLHLAQSKITTPKARTALPKPAESKPALSVATIVLDSSSDEEEKHPKRSKLSESPKQTPVKANLKTGNWLSTGNTSRTNKPSTSTASSSSSVVAKKQETSSRPSTSKLEEKPKTVDNTRLVANDLNKINPMIEDYIDVVYPKGEAIKKFEASHPYNFFLTTIVASPLTHKEPLSITMQEILDSSLGDLESSVQINFMIDIGWLLAHYYFAGHDQKPLLILHGDETPELAKISSVRKNVTAIKIEMGNPFSTHHTKIMLLGYKDKSMRIVVGTANMYEDDWRNRTQGLWISPRCYEMDNRPNSASGESVTGFRGDLIRYLNSYNQPRLQEWTARIQNTNFEAVKVFLICSVPGSHQTMGNDPKWGHLRVGNLLSKHCAAIDDTCPLICQSSSIGSLGYNVGTWVSEISTSFCRDSGPKRMKRSSAFKMIFPSYSNVVAGHDGLMSGGCLPYRRENHLKQTWLENHLHQWRANQRHRTQAIPHIKTYCRYSEKEGLYWFCLTSSNLSKAAWGSVNKNQKLGQVIRVSNYEMGVLFVPKIMINRSTFPLKPDAGGVATFPMPYDLPLVPYSIDDAPFFMDHLL